MKPLHILLAVAIIIVIGFVWNAQTAPTEEPAQTAQPTETQSPEDTKDTTDIEVSGGTDIHMEYPDVGIVTIGEVRVFNVDGSNFAFDITEMHVKQGDTVTINFKSVDGFHDLVIDEFNARTKQVRTGGVSEVTFVADKKGTFEYYCSVGSHRMQGMVGTLIVE